MKVKHASQIVVVQRSQKEDKLSELKCKAKSKKEVKSESETCESNCGGSVFSKEDK